jgi:glycerol-3-phosphate dehydrogenase
VLIVGGGINGAGLFRELALEGVEALLVDKGDFASGASSASTRVIHGGLRYLESGEFRLVRESLWERNRLLRNAPHYVRPLATTIPIFNWTSGLLSAPARFLGLGAPVRSRGAVLVKIGLCLYDLLAGGEGTLPRHQFQSRAQSLAARPQLHPEIVCTAIYHDAWISHPERLCLELVLDATRECPGSQALGYVRLEFAQGDRAVLRDEIDGQSLEVKPQVVVNATGAWIDLTNRALGRPTQFIGGTKGSHLILDHRELLAATKGQMLYFTNADGRICVFYPFFGKVLAGTTDIPISDPETARCEEVEVDYILESVGRVFPSLRRLPDRSNIVYRYCGVRPLPRSDAARPGEISRDHRCAVMPAGDGTSFSIYSLIGGKWTTFRAFAEQTADGILKELGRPRRVSSAALAIGGGRGYPQTAAEKSAWLGRWAAETGLGVERLEVLLDRYGTGAESVAQFLSEAPDQPLASLPEYTGREIQYMGGRESVVHLDDLILRRTILALSGRISRAVLEEVAGALAPVLGWSGEETEHEVERTADLLVRTHGVALPGGVDRPPAHP